MTPSAPLRWPQRALQILALASVAAGCAPKMTAVQDRAASAEEARETAVTEQPASVELLPEPAGAVVTPEADLRLGTGDLVNLQAAPPGAGPAGESAVTLNFQGTDVQEVAKVILSDLLKQNYVIDPGVSGAVNIETSSGIRREDLLPVLETILEMNGAALVVDAAGLYRIVPKETSLKGAVAPRGQSAAVGYGVQIVPLAYIAVAEIQKILEPFLEEGSLVYADQRRNLLMLAGTPEERQRYLETIRVFDVDWMQGMSVGLFPLRHVDSQTLIDELGQALGGEPGQLFDGLVRLVPIERMNAVLAVTPRPGALVETRTWIERLDRAGEQAGRRLFVYRLQNAKAVDLAAILNEIFADEGGARLPPVALAPGATPVEMRAEAQAGDAPQAVARLDQTGAAFSGNAAIRIIADEINNALVILATAQEYDIVESAIRQLDIMPLQVLIGATIVEVTLTDSLEYGVEWFFKNNFDSKQGEGLLDLGAVGLSQFAPAFSYALVDDADRIRAVFNALETESTLNVLSSPSLMVLDNQTASINVGDEIPIPTRQSTSNLDPIAPTVNEIQYRNTGVTLSVTPRVNAGGLVTMEIEQEVADAVETTSSDLNAPTIATRRINSVVAVHSGETVVLGGLIRDSTTRAGSGIPVLRDIPLLGKLFGQTTDSGRRTELLVLITPRAVASRTEARDVTEEFRRKLRAFAPPAGAGPQP
jgi:general secretion pathway protein D